MASSRAEAPSSAHAGPSDTGLGMCPPITMSASDAIPSSVTGEGGARSSRGELGHDHESGDLHDPEDPSAVDEALHQLLDDLGSRPQLLQLEEDGDVRRLEQAEGKDGHDADDDHARDDPAMVRVARQVRAELRGQLPPR